MTTLRPYQREAVDALFDHWADGGGNALIELATGLGKSVVLAEVKRELLRRAPHFRLLSLVHVRELVEQNFTALRRVWPDAPAGIYSAGLGRKDAHHKITVASVQSVFRKAAVLGIRHVVAIDECHLLPASGDGMYLTLLEKLRDLYPDLLVFGTTATPFRLGTGRLDEGEGRLFERTVYTYGIGEGVRDGYLTGLISKGGDVKIDTSGVKMSGGEFIAGALEAAADVEAVTNAAANEIVALGEGRRSWLVFCTGVKHAGNVCDALTRRGITAAVVTGETPAGERARVFRDYRAGKIRALCGANIFTTGFDAPGVDLIAFLRPTASAGLYLQMAGRGVRLADPAIGNLATADDRLAAIAASSKPNCLVLDFAGNVQRHGPVDDVQAPKARKKGERSGPPEVRAKECPECSALLALAARQCGNCGHEFPPPPPAPKHAPEADTTPILAGRKSLASGEPVEFDITAWSAATHMKFGSPPSLCVTYESGSKTFREWICLEHEGFAKHKAVGWWVKHSPDGSVPATIEEALNSFGDLRVPAAIMVRRNGKYDEIVGRSFEVAA